MGHYTEVATRAGDASGGGAVTTVRLRGVQLLGGVRGDRVHRLHPGCLWARVPAA